MAWIPAQSQNVKSLPGTHADTNSSRQLFYSSLQALDVLQTYRASCAVSAWTSKDGKR